MDWYQRGAVAMVIQKMGAVPILGHYSGGEKLKCL